MNKDAIVFTLLLSGGLVVLFYNFTDIHEYPYFTVSTFFLMMSIGLFFIFLPSITKEWVIPIVAVNFVTVVAIPILEGFNWLGFSLLYLVLLSFIPISYNLYKK
ncbi:hypothetical protein [Evansella tamaricis]|uniref:NADH dehydrogenase subunit 6 n=1 Tax=Evansella tamaricis TaxID=2069301 RepID=A0ABS6JDN6_9BACI|nr:hypothetical protein [Evansella tamaricis]MBU9711510.1 hypothetical protein [Evansella tamaricis]